MMRIFALTLCGVFVLSALAEGAPAQSRAPARRVTVGLGVEGDEEQFLLMSMVTGLVSVPITLSSEQIVLVPGAGFGYLFNPMVPASTSLYAPVQLAVRIRSVGIDLQLRHYFAFPEVLSSGIFTAVVRGSIPLWERSHNEITLGVDFGSAVFWQSSGPPAFTFTVGPAFGYAHTW